MCSDMCPCDSNAYASGGYASLDDFDLWESNRVTFRGSGDFSNNMMFTRNILDGWLLSKGSANDGYSDTTKKILQYGGGNIAASDPYAWIFRTPPTV